ncbi:MAG: hypothetical protein V1715_00095, partial [bacterium]
VGLDGSLGAGKKTLARSLANEFSGSLIQFDKYLRDISAEKYSDFLKLDELKIDLENKLKSQNIVFVVGICLQEILGKIDIVPDIIIYVRNKHNNFWTNMDIDKTELEVIINKIKMDSNKVEREDLGITNAKYHHYFSPVARSDIFYEW